MGLQQITVLVDSFVQFAVMIFYLVNISFIVVLENAFNNRVIDGWTGPDLV